jgi:ER-bound oxygenase mpaB/B'/Rubber oxygenase, catalytic domain
VVTSIFEARGPTAIDHLRRGLFHYEAAEDALPAEAASFIAEPVEGVQKDIGRGQTLFQELGPEVLLILGCYSLPAAYAATRGARVLAQTGFLTEDTDRRLGETSQMVVDVMTTSGLEPGGAGIWAARKVRLMHAAIRHLVLARHDLRWDTERDGIPINQEDLAATLMTFSYLVVTGLRRLGFWVSNDEAEEYLAAWKAVGRLMGVLPELIPVDFDEAGELTETIEARQVAPGDVGRGLTKALLAVLDAKTAPGVPAALMRRMLPGAVCDGLGVPRDKVRDGLVVGLCGLVRLVDPVLQLLGTRTAAYRRFSMDLVQYLIERDRGGERAAFRLPTELHDFWKNQGDRDAPGAKIANRVLALGAPGRA